MKKGLLVTLIVVAMLALGTAGYAYAQGSQPTGSASTTDTTTSALTGAQGGHGMMGSSFGAGSMGTATGTGDELLHDYFVQAFSAATGLSVDEIEARLAAGETLSDIAVSLGYTLETFRTLILEVRTAALTAAVADGVITQEQADWMLSHMSQMWQGDASGQSWGAGGQMGKGQMSGSQTGTGSASCTMTGTGRGTGQGNRGAGRGSMSGTGTCTQTP
jgi:hypothetical protein